MTTTVDTPTPNNAEIEFLRERIRDLTRAWEGVDAERELAMYKAVKAGASIADVAGWALMKPDEVQAMMAIAFRDPNMDRFSLRPVYR